MGWTGWRDAREGRSEFRGEAGNYELIDRQGRSYIGRQSEGGDRIGAHIRKAPRSFVEVRFLRDHDGSECGRERRERDIIRRRKGDDVQLRNKIAASQSDRCSARSKRR